MITKENIQYERDMSRKKYPLFYADLDKYHTKKGLPKSIRRHEVKTKAKNHALKNKM